MRIHTDAQLDEPAGQEVFTLRYWGRNTAEVVSVLRIFSINGDMARINGKGSFYPVSLSATHD